MKILKYWKEKSPDCLGFHCFTGTYEAYKRYPIMMKELVEWLLLKTEN
jgi:hypothetical protein